ncbi:hypothetical protein ElyMa_003442000, partial [Elysia marginata]
YCCQNRIIPTASIFLESEYFNGDVDACNVSNLIADIILGNIKEIKAASDSSVSCVVTRAQASREVDNSSQISKSSRVKSTSAHARLTERSVSGVVDTDDEHKETDVSIDITTVNNVLNIYSDFRERQKQDNALAAWFKRVGEKPLSYSCPAPPN